MKFTEPTCDFHHGQFTRLDEARKKRVRHPGDGRKALTERAAQISRQCPQCAQTAAPEPKETRP